MLPAKWLQEQGGEYKWAVLILRAQTWAQNGAASALTTQRCSGIWPPGKDVHQETDDGADPRQPGEIASLFWENLSVFPEELMEVEGEKKCLGFSAETADLLTLDIKCWKSQDKEQFKASIILIFMHRTSPYFISTSQIFLDETSLISPLNINSGDMAVKLNIKQ